MSQDIIQGSFVWDEDKEALNKQVHGLDFTEACKAFFDPNRVIALDESHSEFEERFFCIGRVDEKYITVRFTHRGNMIRIIGAGIWRKGRRRYEKENK